MPRYGRASRRLFFVAVVVGSLFVATGGAAAVITIRTVASSQPAGYTPSPTATSLALNQDLVPLASVAGFPTPERVSGADRFTSSIAVSKRAFPGTAPVVYIATGENFPDALSAGPAAAHEGGPLLLTTSASLPSVTQAEIVRLAPGKIVVIGSAASISDSEFSVLQTLAHTVIRIGGSDRFETSRNVATYAFGASGADTAYLVTGLNFPDALAAGSAASLKNSPIILTIGSDTAVGTPTTALLQSLGVTHAYIVGGLPSVSAGIETSTDAVTPTYRIAGDDRFLGSDMVNRETFVDNSDYVILATGLNFPDGLSGTPLAATLHAPLYLVSNNCIPNGVLSDIRTLAATHIILLGDINSLGAGVQSLTPC